ncbi:MAG TPA: alpha/beta hydrolase [Cyclobacteriaceae bacterium]
MKNRLIKKVVPKIVGGYLNTLAVLSPSRVGKIGFDIFCTPIAPSVKPHHKAYLETGTLFNFESDGTTLQGYRWGNGERKIVFLHGWQSHSYRWKKYIQAFSQEEYSIYAFDAPAHGLSGGKYANIPLYSNAINNFFEIVGAVESVVTHSMGSISTLHALYHQNHLKMNKLVLMGSPGEASDFISFYQNYTGLTDRTLRFILDHFVKTMKKTPEYFSAPQFATRVKIPGLIIHDEGDDEAPYRHAVRIHKAWTNSKLITTQGHGHNLRSPDVIAMVKEFTEEQRALVK